MRRDVSVHMCAAAPAGVCVGARASGHVHGHMPDHAHRCVQKCVQAEQANVDRRVKVVRPPTVV